MRLKHWTAICRRPASPALHSSRRTPRGRRRSRISTSGKTVTIYVGFGPGGGYDAYAQLLAPFIRRHIPGKPNVIVKHMPGAGSLALMNYLWSVAPPDGTVLRHPGIERGVRATDRLAAGEGRGEVRCRRSSAGSAASNSSRRSASPGTPPASRRSQDVKQRPLRFGSSGASSGGEMFAQMLNDIRRHQAAIRSAAITAPTRSRSPWSAARSMASSAGAGAA